mmetsp:Transcript_44500/g.83445  ORF Transcript_44500/g.83445 Transcript_44500/m.83445 type:complete len:229 (-) Transcript_44500:311-997(-)
MLADSLIGQCHVTMSVCHHCMLTAKGLASDGQSLFVHLNSVGMTALLAVSAGHVRISVCQDGMLCTSSGAVDSQSLVVGAEGGIKITLQLENQGKVAIRIPHGVMLCSQGFQGNRNSCVCRLKRAVELSTIAKRLRESTQGRGFPQARAAGSTLLPDLLLEHWDGYSRIHLHTSRWRSPLLRCCLCRCSKRAGWSHQRWRGLHNRPLRTCREAWPLRWLKGRRHGTGT